MKVNGFVRKVMNPFFIARSRILPIRPSTGSPGNVSWQQRNPIASMSLRGAALGRRSNPLLCTIITFAILCLTACVPSATSLPVVVPSRVAVSATPAEHSQSPTPSATATLPPTPTSTPTYRVTLDAVGDIMLARTVGDQVLEKGPQVVFAGVQSILDSADIRVGNLECALTERNTPEKKSFPLKAPLQTVQALALAKFDLLSLANNHAMDYGYAGLQDTQATLSHSGIATVGAGSNVSYAHAPAIIEKNGLRLAFLAYADVMPENSGFDPKNWVATDSKPGIAWADPAQITTDVKAAKHNADLVIVLLHSGYEIGTYIPVISASQRAEAQAAIDAGATLVVGSHPHVLEKIEPYHGGLIAYSLGNFVFDQYAGIANATVILRVILSKQGIQSFDWVPVLIENGLPRSSTNQEIPAIGTMVAPTGSLGQ